MAEQEQEDAVTQTEDTERKRHITDLITSIRTDRSRRTERKCAPKERTRPYTKSGRGRGKRSDYKIPVGWQHYNRKRYRVVTNAKGGGLRNITRKADEDITVGEIMQEAKKFFFKDGNSYFGSLEDMEVCMVNSSGQQMYEFTDTNGAPCSFKDYLQEYGMFPSQCHMYLQTKNVNDTKTDTKLTPDTQVTDPEVCIATEMSKKKVFLVNNQEVQHISILYGKVIHSLYSDSASAIHSQSYNTCRSLTNNNNETDEDYNVFDDGYMIRAVSKGSKQYLLETESTYSFPETEGSDPSSMQCIIIHGPEEIHGVETDDSEHLVLGVLTLYHNQARIYKWYKDGNIIESGKNRCLIRITEPGTYRVEIMNNLETISSQPVSVCIQEQISFSSSSHQNIMEQVAIAGPSSSHQNIMEQVAIAGPSSSHQNIMEQVAIAGPSSSHQNIMEQVAIAGPSSSHQNIMEQVAIAGPSSSHQNIMEQVAIAGPSSLHQNIMEQVAIAGPSSSHQNIMEQVAIAGPSSLHQNIMEQVAIAGPSSLHQNIMEQVAIAGPSSLHQNIMEQVAIAGPSSSHQNIMEQVAIAGPSSSHQNIMEQVAIAGPSSSHQNIMEQVAIAGPSSLHQNIMEQVAIAGPSSSHQNIMEQVAIAGPSSSHQNIMEQVAIAGPSSSHQNIMEQVAIAGPSSLHQDNIQFHSGVPKPSNSNSSQFLSSFSGEKVGVPQVDITDIVLGEQIGKGAFGTVFKGEWLGTTVAVKEIIVKRMKIVRSMIERELSVHSMIRHPCIVQLMAFAVSKNKLYLVTEFVEGNNLDDVLFGGEDDSSEVMSVLQKLQVSRKIIQAIAYLHNQCPAIIHRDVKPENVLVSGDFGTVRLCDMGLSKLKTMNTLITTIASSSAMQPGTPAYQAPEVLVHRQSGTRQSDIWSLSGTLLELFAEVPLWQFEENGSDSCDVDYITKRMQEKKSPDGVSTLVAKVNVPLPIVNIIMKGLDYNPQERPSAVELLQVLQGQ